MHADDQHFLVIGTVEDADPSAFRQIARGAPEKIVLQFGGAGMLEAEHLAALRVDAGHHMPDGAVFSRRIHRLKDQQDGIAVGRVEQLLLRTQLRNVLLQKFLILLLRLVHGIDFVGHFLRSTLSPSRTRKSFASIFILSLPAVQIACVALLHLGGLSLRISRSAWSQSCTA